MSQRRPGRRRWWWLLLAVLVLGVIVVAIAGVAAVGVALDVTDARQQAERGRQLLLSGDPKAARVALSDSAASFGRARSGLDNLALGVLRRVPFAGPNIRAVDGLAAAGELTAQAGVAISGGLTRVAGGDATLATGGGRLPLDALVALRRPLRRAEPLLADASRVASGTPSEPLIGPVAEAREALVPQLLALSDGVAAGRQLSEQLPPFLGADGERRYFFGASTPAELRGTGGLIGSYTIVTVDDGRLQFGGPFRASSALPRFAPDEIRPPSREYAQRYDRFGGAGFVSNLNLTPDFPSAATALERLYEQASGERVDGTIVVDPFALEALVRLTGPVDIPRLGQVDADNLVDVVTNTAYARFDDQTRRKEVLGRVAAGVFGSFLDGDAGRDPVTTLRALAAAGGDGHLLLHARDPQVQRALEGAGVAGRLLDPPGDYLSVVVNNGAANKIDYYAERRVRYRAALAEDGSVLSTATVQLRNTAPAAGDRVVVGPYRRRFEAGENVSLTTLYGPSGAELTAYRRGDEQASVRVGSELGHPAWEDTIRLTSGQAGTMAWSWRLPDGWEGSTEQGSYRLTVQGQPTIRPTRLSVAVDLPPGVDVVSMSPELRVRRGRVTYDGRMPAQADLRIEFAQPLGARLWDDLRGFLAQPLW